MVKQERIKEFEIDTKYVEVPIARGKTTMKFFEKGEMMEFIADFEKELELHRSAKCGLIMCDECASLNDKTDQCLESLKEWLDKCLERNQVGLPIKFKLERRKDNK